MTRSTKKQLVLAYLMRQGESKKGAAFAVKMLDPAELELYVAKAI